MRRNRRVVHAPRLGALLLAALICGATARAQQSADAQLLAAKFKEATEAQRGGQFDRAAAAYAEVIKLRPDIAEVYMNYGLVRYEQKQFEQAAQLISKAIELKPTLGGTHFFLGLTYYSLNRFDDAAWALETAIAADPQNATARMWLGVVLLAANKPAEAAKHLDAATVLDPKNVDILYHRGRAHLRLSQESYQQMFKLQPDSARVHQVLAQSYQEAGREEEAIREYQETIKLAPTLPGVHEALGSLYWKMRNLQAAEGEFQKEIAVDPYNALALYKLGSIRVESGNAKDGLPLLETAIRLNLNEIDAYYYLGKAQGQLGQTDAAVVNLRRVVEGEAVPEMKESAYYQLSLIYRKLGRADEAKAALASFQTLRSERERRQAESIEKKRQQPQLGQGAAAEQPRP